MAAIKPAAARSGKSKGKPSAGRGGGAGTRATGRPDTTTPALPGLIDPQTVARDLGITKSDLAATLGLPADALLRAERVRAEKTQARLGELMEIIGRVEPWCGTKRAAFAWYRGQGIAALGDETAEAMVKTNRAGVVRTYLNAIAAGSFA